MSSYYDAFGSSSIEREDPYADELELERRDAEMEPDEPKWEDLDDATAMALDSDEYDWSDLNDEADNINVITGEVEE